MKHPIETAPRDGRKILLYGDLRLLGYYFEESDVKKLQWHIGFWHPEEMIWSDADCGQIFYPTYWAELPSVDE